VRAKPAKAGFMLVNGNTITDEKIETHQWTFQKLTFQFRGSQPCLMRRYDLAMLKELSGRARLWNWDYREHKVGHGRVLKGIGVDSECTIENTEWAMVGY
jgi:hypothetical protein